MSEARSQDGKAYQVVARRFRPTSFDHVVGQEAVLATLRSCLDSGRLPHAFLFTGSRGVGKTTSARILARAVNCAEGPTSAPCGTCEACRAILDGTASDVIELDAASNNSVEDVRALREQAGYAPLRLRRKVFILDEVHMFSKSAFNALLKVLEEPPEHVLFVLATTELHKVPETVRSRCQVLPFRRIGEGDIAGRLRQIAESEGVAVAPDILAEVAASSMGGMRDAETALERLLPIAEGLDLEAWRRLEGRLGLTRAAELVAACLAGDARAALAWAASAVETGVDERECLGELLSVLRQAFLLAVDGPDSVLVEAAGEWRERLLTLVEAGDPQRLDAMMQLVILARERIRHFDDRRVVLELTLYRLARVDELTSLGELAATTPAPAARPATPRGAPAAGPAATAASTKGDRAGDEAAADPWVACLEALRAERRTVLANALEKGAARWPAPDRCEVTLPQLRGTARTLLEKPESLALVRDALGRAAGREVEVGLVFGEGAAAKPAEAPAPPRGVQDPELPELGKAAKDLFGARLLDRGEGRP